MILIFILTASLWYYTVNMLGLCNVHKGSVRLIQFRINEFYRKKKFNSLTATELTKALPKFMFICLCLPGRKKFMFMSRLNWFCLAVFMFPHWSEAHSPFFLSIFFSINFPFHLLSYYFQFCSIFILWKVSESKTFLALSVTTGIVFSL